MANGMAFIIGAWVPTRRLHPETDLLGGEWMSEDGERHGTYSGGPIPEKVLWYIPPPSLKGLGTTPSAGA